MPAPIVWGLPVSTILFSLRTLSRSGGLSILGQEQVVQSSLESWKARLTTTIRSANQAVTYRAYMAQSLGRSNPWLVPVCAGFQVLGNDGTIRSISPVQRATFSDTSTFSDSSVFETKLVMGTVVANAATGSRSLSVRLNYRPLPGQYFSIGNYLYLISYSPDIGGSDFGPDFGVDFATGFEEFTITFTPPLRVAANAGDVMDFSQPRCLMRLASDDTGQLELESLRFSTVSVDFVEVPPT